MPPTQPHPVAITLKQSNGSARGSTKLRVINRNTGNEIYVTTNSQGQAVADLANFTEGYTADDTIVIEKVKENVTSTVRFEGTINRLMSKTESGMEMMEIGGGHVSDSLLDITVTREYEGDTTCDTILKELVDNYLTGFTYTNVTASVVTPNIKWSNKPFWEAVEDLCKLSIPTAEVTRTKTRFDCYVDDDKDFHFFEENSIETTTDAIVWNDTLIELTGFGEEQNVIKNKIIAYGYDDTGLPIIDVATDTSSQNSYGTKEMVITDKDLNTYSKTAGLASANLNNQKDPKKEGQALCFWLPTINPGEKIWISEPTSKIIEQNKIFKYTHRYPLERTHLILTKTRNVATLFRDRILKDIAQDIIVNPYEMTKSLNFPFDNANNLSAQDDNVTITEGKIKLSSGTTGEFVTKTFSQNDNITNCHLKVVGEQNTDTVYKVSTDGGENYTVVLPETLTSLTLGKDIIIKVQLNNANAEIDSIALLIK